MEGVANCTGGTARLSRGTLLNSCVLLSISANMLPRLIIIITAVLLTSCTVALITSCTAEQLTNVVTDSKSSFVVNGSGYTEAKFKGYALDTASFARQVDSAAGLVVIAGLTTKSTENFAITITSQSIAPGSYQINGGLGTTMTLVTTSGSTPVTYIATSGSVTIDSWGAVSGQCKGRFSGSFVLPSDPTNAVLQVTAGVFDVKRAS